MIWPCIEGSEQGLPNCSLSVASLATVDGPVNPSALLQGTGKGKVAGLLSFQSSAICGTSQAAHDDKGLVMSISAPRRSHCK